MTPTDEQSSKYPILDDLVVPEDMLQAWQGTIDLLAEIVDVPAALIMRVHPREIEVFLASHSKGDVYARGEKAPLDTGLYCETVMSTRQELLVPDATRDPLWDHNPDIKLGMISYCGLPLVWPTGEIFGTLCILDIKENHYTEQYRKLMEQFRDSIQFSLRSLHYENSLRQDSEEKYRRLVESLESDYFLYSHDMDGVFTYVSPSISSVLGFKPEEYMIHCSKYLTDNPVNQEALLHTEAAIRGERRPAYQLEVFHKDGSTRWLEVMEYPITDEQKQVIGVEGIAHDITEQKKASDAFAVLAYQNTLILESAGEGIFGLDREGNHTFVNPAAAKILGWNAEEMLGRRSHSMWHHTQPNGSFYPDSACPIYATLHTGMTHSGEEYFVRKDGTVFPVEFVANPIIEEGGIIGAVVSFMDISERKEQEQQLRSAMAQTVQSVAATMEKRDPYTAGHQRRVTDLAFAIGEELGLDEEKIEGLKLSSMIHDIGKVSIPSEILSRPGRLSEIEFSLIKEHPKTGHEILQHITFPWPVAEIIQQHHERIDGSGYPFGLKGDDILLEAKIIAVADVVEAMASDRPYRPSLGIDSALDELEKGRDTRYQPEVVDACLTLFREKGYTMA